MDEKERKIFWDTLNTLKGINLAAESEMLQQTIKYPKYLYRYKPINFNSLESLQENKQFFSSAIYYDDPFDTYLHIDWNKVKERIVSLDIRHEVETKIIPFLRSMGITNDAILDANAITNYLTSQKILETTVILLNKTIRPTIQRDSFSICFGESDKNENLWLKYADHHKGFCLIYDVEKIDFLRCKKNCETLDFCTKRLCKLYPVHYSTKKYDATEYAINCAIEFILRQSLTPFFLSEKFRSETTMFWEKERTSLIKHKCHEYDQEWRIIYEGTPDKNLFLKLIPDAVILGMRIDDRNAKIVVRSAKMAGIKKIKKAYVNFNDEFDIMDVPEERINELLER